MSPGTQEKTVVPLSLQCSSELTGAEVKREITSNILVYWVMIRGKLLMTLILITFCCVAVFELSCLPFESEQRL